MSPREWTPHHAVAEQASEPLRALIDHAPHAMLLVSLDGAILGANARAEPLLDAPTALLVGKRITDVLPERAHALLLRRLAVCEEGEGPEDLELLLDQRASTAFVNVTFLPAPPYGVALLIRDLTRSRAEAQAYERATAENQKMIDLGRLIAGVTHEMRTPLTYVTNNLMLLQAELREIQAGEPALAKGLEHAARQAGNAIDGLDRLHRLLAELRPLAKNKPHRTVLVNLAELVLDAVKVFEATKAGSTRIELDLESTHLVPVDRNEMLNVLANLLNNAAQAMDDAGTIHISTRNRDTPPEIRVSDTGPGVPPEARAHLFEPFSTTKPDGTGLGLFISRRTVEAHGGTLTYEDAPGAGATFVVRLPTPTA